MNIKLAQITIEPQLWPGVNGESGIDKKSLRVRMLRIRIVQHGEKELNYVSPLNPDDDKSVLDFIFDHAKEKIIEMSNKKSEPKIHTTQE